MSNCKKYLIGLMLQDFCFGDNYKKILSPEIQNIFILKDIKRLSDKGHLYDIDFILSDGKVISDDLSSVKGLISDYNYDFIIYVHQQPSFDVFRVCVNWVPQEYLLNYSFWQINNDPLQSSAIIKIIKDYNYDEKNVILNATHNKLLTKNSHDCTYLSFNPFYDLIPPIFNYENATVFYSCATLPLERHGSLIKELDKRDYCRFYGHKSQWPNIRNYQKQIDYGYEIYSEINNNGIALAIHSKVHCDYEFYTNRIAESCIGGAIIITDKFSNLQNLFGDSIFTIDTKKPSNEIANQIDKIVKWIRENPENARKKAIKSQSIFADNFMKKDWIYKICQTIDKAKNSYIEEITNISNNSCVDIIYNCEIDNELKFKKILDQILKQYHKNFNLLVYCNEQSKTKLIKITNSTIKNNKNIKIEFISDSDFTNTNTGFIFLEATKKFKGNYFTFIEDNSSWNKDHISRLIWEIEQDQKMQYLCAYSGVALTNNGKFYGLDNKTKSTVIYPIRISNILDFFNPAHIEKESSFFNTFENEVELRFPKGAQLFKKEVTNLIDDNIDMGFKVLNNCEHIALLVLLAIENKMSYVHFSPYISYTLDIENKEDILSVEKIRHSLYPKRKVGDYIQSLNCISGQLSKIFFDNNKFRSAYSIFGIHNNSGNNFYFNCNNQSNFDSKNLKKKYIQKITKLINKYNTERFTKFLYYLLKIYCTAKRILLSPKRKLNRIKKITK